MPTKQPQKKGTKFDIVSSYKWGYRNREDITNLPAGVLIKGSQNVITNMADRVQIRKGYALDGATSDVASAILASYDWMTRGNGERHLRAGFLTSAANDGKLQYRYVAPSTGSVTWRDLLTSLTSVSYNFTTFWDTTENLRVVLFVNGASQIQEWNGAYTELLSSTANTLTKAGDTWLDAGFYSTGTRSVVINGTTYTYTGGDGTTTLTGVTPDPSAEPVGAVVHQSVRTTANSSLTGVSATFENGLISTMNNQVFLGALNSSVMYLSNVNSYTDYSSSATRQPGEGGTLILDQNLVAFNVQGSENIATMYVSAGTDIWYKITFTDYVSVVGPSGQTLGAVPIKSGKRQGAKSQAFVSNMKNNTIALSNEPNIDLIGVMENYFTQSQTKNISEPIKNDVDSYDFTNGSIFYFRDDIYVAVPAEGLVLVYDLTVDHWQSPLTLPVSRFYIVDGELYGHSYATSESYKLFTGYADRVYTGFAGYPINAKWIFSYQNYGTRTDLKSATYLYVEGYISANTVATANITYELDGCATVKTFEIDGSDTQIVCIPNNYGSLGKTSLGKQKLGGDVTESIQGLPPKFRVQKSFSNTDFFENSVSFEVLGTDNRLELLAFGLNTSMSTQEPIQNRQA
jgi:hypothetical protein